MSDKDDDLGMWDEAMDEQAEAAAKAETVELEELEEDAPITGDEKRKLDAILDIPRLPFWGYSRAPRIGQGTYRRACLR